MTDSFIQSKSPASVRPSSPDIHADIDILQTLRLRSRMTMMLGIDAQEILSGQGRVMRRPLQNMLSKLYSHCRQRSTYGVVGEECGRWYEERQVDAVQTVLPSESSICDHAVVPIELGQLNTARKISSSMRCIPNNLTMWPYLSFELSLQEGDPRCKSLRLLNSTLKRAFKIKQISVEPTLSGEGGKQPSIVRRNGDR